MLRKSDARVLWKAMHDMYKRPLWWGHGGLVRSVRLLRKNSIKWVFLFNWSYHWILSQ